jgi:hypothetical protein
MGIFDRIQQGAKIIGATTSFAQKVLGGGPGYLERAKQILDVIPDIQKFVGETKKLVEKFSNETIKTITSCRTPLSGVLQNVVKGLYHGPVAIDKLFHLFLKIGLGNGSTIVFEKNERPMMSMYSGPRADQQERNIPVSGGLTIGDMISNAIKKVGSKNYFVYDPFQNNCQDFQLANLSASPQIHMSGEDRKWIDQDAKDIAKGVPSWAKSFSAEVIQGFAKISGRLV